jgi:hypothetical protein
MAFNDEMRSANIINIELYYNTIKHPFIRFISITGTVSSVEKGERAKKN